MKAMVLERAGPIENQPLKLREVEPPRMGRFDALMEVKACGVCGTDLSIVEGRFKPPRLPIVPGHEAIGRVLAVGEDASGLVREGDLIGAYWVHSSCGSCDYCLTGREQLCLERRVNGLDNDGCYAEQMVVDARYAVKIPSGLSPEEAAPFMCAGLTAYRSIKLSGAEPGRRIGVIGVGGLGSFAIQIAKLRGARVTAISRSSVKLEMARRLGADETVPEDEASKMAGEFDSVVLLAPFPKLVEVGMRLLRKGGSMIVAANLDEVPNMPYRSTLASERCVRSVSVGGRQELKELLGLAGSGALRPIPVEPMPLEEANEALLRVKRGDVIGRVVLRP